MKGGSSGTLSLCSQGQREEKSDTSIVIALYPDPAARGVDDGLADRECVAAGAFGGGELVMAAAFAARISCGSDSISMRYCASNTASTEYCVKGDNAFEPRISLLPPGEGSGTRD